MESPKSSEQLRNVEMVYVNCPLCGNNDADTLYEPWNIDVDPRTVLSASGGVRGTQYIVKCRRCNLIYVNPRPCHDVVIEAYAASSDEVYVQAAAGRETTFRHALRIVENYTSGGRLLDVGCAAGFFVRMAREAGWDAIGVEPSQWLANYGLTRLGVEIVPSTLAEAVFPDESFDIVTMWDVIEHVPDPLAELQEVFRILRPGGLLVVNTPNVGSWMARLAGKNWWFFLSVHLTYFTNDTMKAMLAKAGFGDFIVRRHYQTLEFGHLMKMVGLYSNVVSRVGLRLSQTLRIEKLPIRYYASQTNVIAHRKARF